MLNDTHDLSFLSHSSSPAGSINVRAMAAKTKAKKTKAKAKAKAKAKTKTKLLSGGNPQIPKGEGDAPVQAYIAALSDWRKDVCKRLDKLIVRNVPKVKKAVKWNSPFYGIEGKGWFASFHVFTRYVKLTFFKGTSLSPVPGGGKHEEARWVDIHEGELDEAQLSKWVKQAAKIPGWSGGPEK